MRRAFLAIVLLLSLQVPLRAEELIKDPALDAADVYLVTVDLGSWLHARFGHTMIRVVSSSLGDFCINWGLFNFADPMLPLNFFLGKLRYWGAAFTTEATLRSYHDYELRGVRQQKLRLTLEQKQRFLHLAITSIRGENRYFWYDYFYKNCSTIPVEFLNQVLGDKLRQQLASEPAAHNFRYYVRNNLNLPTIMAFFLDIVMNSRIDAPISKWEEMFYPLKVEEYLNAFTNPETNEPLLYLPEVLVDIPGVQAGKATFHPWFLVAGILLAVAAALGRMRWVFLLGFGGFFAVLGWVMMLMWMFSAHLDCHHNVNLCFFWPLDLVYVLLIKQSGRQRLLPVARIISMVHGIVAIFAVGAFFAGFWQQDVGQVIYYILPVSVLLWLLPFRRERQE